MKFQVKVENRVFAVEVGDLFTRPVKVLVDGTPFEVWIEDDPSSTTAEPSTAAPKAAVHIPKPTRGSNGVNRKQVQAPIPGVIDSIAVVEGETVSVGQELLIVEAMKMKNIIRATRSGKIAAILIEKGQHVRHNETLMEFVD